MQMRVQIFDHSINVRRIDSRQMKLILTLFVRVYKYKVFMRLGVYVQ
jgi:hypothetical protein